MNERVRPLLGITMGDPGGIGPEICAKALDFPATYALCRPLVVGDAGIMRDAVRFCRLPLKVRSRVQPSDGGYRQGTIDVLRPEESSLIGLEARNRHDRAGPGIFRVRGQGYLPCAGR